MTKVVSPHDAGKYLQELSSAAKTLNKLTDQLTKEVSGIEDAVNRLNLGVETSVPVESWTDESGDHSGLWRLAYGKYGGKWCLYIEYLTEHSIAGPMADTYESWFFKDAPRDARIKAVAKIPDLLAMLVKESQDFAVKIGDKVTYAQEIAKSLAPATEVDTLREAVLGALSNQPMLVSLLETADWTLDGNSLAAKVAASATMIEMSFTADARRLAGAAASGRAARPIKVQVLPGSLPPRQGSTDLTKVREGNQ